MAHKVILRGLGQIFLLKLF